jgi:hypothetical protein
MSFQLSGCSADIKTTGLSESELSAMAGDIVFGVVCALDSAEVDLVSGKKSRRISHLWSLRTRLSTAAGRLFCMNTCSKRLMKSSVPSVDLEV